MTPLLKRTMLLLLSLTLSVSGLGAAFAQNDVRDCRCDHATMARQGQEGPSWAKSVGAIHRMHMGSADPCAANCDARHPGVAYCPHCAALGASAPSFLNAAAPVVDALAAPFEAPPYIGAVFPDERPTRLERPPAALSLS